MDKILSANRRFVQGKRIGICNPVDVNLGTMADSQSPIAAVLSCSDSRVPPARVPDRKKGEIFVVRVADKVPVSAVIRNLEYAFEHLKVFLMHVFGYEGCGAVEDALEVMGGCTDGTPGNLIKELEPAVMPLLIQREKYEDVLHEAAYASVRCTIDRILERSRGIADAFKKGALLIKGAVYALLTGELSLLEQRGQGFIPP
jgi:carbonic anhydrase